MIDEGFNKDTSNREIRDKNPLPQHMMNLHERIPLELDIGDFINKKNIFLNLSPFILNPTLYNLKGSDNSHNRAKVSWNIDIVKPMGIGNREQFVILNLNTCKSEYRWMDFDKITENLNDYPLFILKIKIQEVKDDLNLVLEAEISPTSKEKSRTFADAGESLRLKGYYSEAIKAFDSAISLDPINAYAFERKGHTLREMSIYDDSIEILKKALELNYINDFTHAELGESLRSNRQLNDAIKEFEIAISINPKCGWAYERKGATLREQGVILLNQGDASQAQVKFRESIDNLNCAIDIDPKNAWIFAELGESYHWIGEYENARKAFDDAINMDLRKACVFANVGLVFKDLGINNRAVDALRKASQLEPQNAEILARLSECLRQTGRNTEALQIANRALSIDPDLLWAKSYKAAICNELNKCDEALELINEVLKENDTVYADVYAKKLKAIILNNIAKYEEALSTIDEAIAQENENKNYWSHIIKGWILENLNDFEKAVETYNVALELESRSDIERIKCCAFLGVADSYFSLYIQSDRMKEDCLARSNENYKKAADLLKTQIDNIDAYTLSRIGWCQFRLGHFDDAERLFIDALSLHPERIECQFLIGLASICKEKFELAFDEYNKGIELSKNNCDPSRCKGILLTSIHELNETIEYKAELKDNQTVKEILNILKNNLSSCSP